MIAQAPSNAAQSLQPSTRTNKRLWAGRILGGLTSLFILVDGVMKLVKPPAVVGGITMKLFTNLNYPGNCRQALHFYQQHLGGKITMMVTNGQGAADRRLSRRMERCDSPCAHNPG